ncbi:hypothetical protein ABZW30_21760 [Kitasatospora sp. NPDC004669]|uniref:hypothetical protein n=1 Tax=Kitasatospora sp. NPDC004669 TaxID=3154555 RepID=UPI0033B1F59A
MAAGVWAGTVAAVLSAAPTASAQAPTRDCTGMYSARITQWAMLCANAGQPIRGAFATWRNLPITFDSSNNPNIMVGAANYLTVTPDIASSATVRIGLYAQKTDAQSASYAPHWEEVPDQGGGRETAVNVGVGPNQADGRNHSYLLQRQDNGDQWEVFYDFNSVGTTTGQKPVSRASEGNRIDVGLEVNHPEHVDVPVFEDRALWMDENKVWARFAPANTATQLGLGKCGDPRPGSNTPYTAPYCFTAQQKTNTQPLPSPPGTASWSAGKPLATPAPIAPVSARSLATPALERPTVFNGVDQETLHTCLQNTPDACLTTVPGLADCLRTAKQCNADQPPTALRRKGDHVPPALTTDVNVDDLKLRTAAEFGVPVDSLRVSAGTVADDSSGRRRAARWDADTPLWVITSDAPNRGRQQAGPQSVGLAVTYTQSTGDIVDACWGSACSR